jgi:hypothetical protein
VHDDTLCGSAGGRILVGGSAAAAEVTAVAGGTLLAFMISEFEPCCRAREFTISRNEAPPWTVGRRSAAKLLTSAAISRCI